jgi:hypothetical protein
LILRSELITSIKTNWPQAYKSTPDQENRARCALVRGVPTYRRGRKLIQSRSPSQGNIKRAFPYIMNYYFIWSQQNQFTPRIAANRLVSVNQIVIDMWNEL